MNPGTRYGDYHRKYHNSSDGQQIQIVLRHCPPGHDSAG